MSNSSTLRWGIIGPGTIASAFAKALQVTGDSCLHAVAGRNKAKAETFSHLHGVALRYDSHTALLNNPDIDAVYIATPHRYHFELARDCLLAGKPVLCEKPLSVNAREAQSLIDLSRQHDVFLMEAMWTRFLPIYADIRQWLVSGAIGSVKSITSSLGFVFERGPNNRLFSNDLAGGALLDLGVYNLAISQWVYGTQSIQHLINGHIGETGVDEQDEIKLDYGGGRSSTFSISLRQQLDNDLTIHGERGYIRVHPMFWGATTATLVVDQNSPDRAQSTTITREFRATGLEYEIDEAARCIREGLIESGKMPHRDSLETMQLMDKLRRDMGLAYAFE